MLGAEATIEDPFALCGSTAAAARSANQLPLVTNVSFWPRSVGGARSMLGQHRDDDIARVEQDGFLFVRRDLDEAKSSEQENSFNSQQCVTDFMHLATFRSKRIEQFPVIASHWLQHVRPIPHRSTITFRKVRQSVGKHDDVILAFGDDDRQSPGLRVPKNSSKINSSWLTCIPCHASRRGQLIFETAAESLWRSEVPNRACIKR